VNIGRAEQRTRGGRRSCEDLCKEEQEPSGLNSLLMDGMMGCFDLTLESCSLKVVMMMMMMMMNALKCRITKITAIYKRQGNLADSVPTFLWGRKEIWSCSGVSVPSYHMIATHVVSFSLSLIYTQIPILTQTPKPFLKSISCLRHLDQVQYSTRICSDLNQSIYCLCDSFMQSDRVHVD
jgi:hypothetical protein